LLKSAGSLLCGSCGHADQRQEPKRFQGENMKNKYLRILLAVLCFAGMGITAAAQGRDLIVVTLPFPSVASGKILPAGKYIVRRVSDDKLEGLILSSYDAHTSIIVHPIEVEDTSEDNPQVSFTKVAGQNFLSSIRTAYHIYNLPLSRPATMEATFRSHQHTNASESSGNN
jgi:hypothetical protein